MIYIYVHGVAIMCALRVIILCTCICMHSECLMVLQLVMLYVCLLFFFLLFFFCYVGCKRSFVIHGCWLVKSGVMSLIVVLVS